MIFIAYFFIGFFVTIVGALPLGTVNVAVINTTIKETVQSAIRIIVTAALAEVILVLLALNFNRTIQNFITMNIWLQYTLVVLFITIGIILVLGRKACIKDKNGECILIKKRKIPISKAALGFLLGLFNPTVLIYWIIALSLLFNNGISLMPNTALVLILIFVVGVYLGKAITLYAYARFSNVLKVKITSVTTKINGIIGVLLLFAGIIQFVKLTI